MVILKIKFQFTITLLRSLDETTRPLSKWYLSFCFNIDRIYKLNSLLILCVVFLGIDYSNKSNNVSDQVTRIVFSYGLQRISLKLLVLSIKTR